MSTERKVIDIQAIGEVSDIGAGASRAIPKLFRYRYVLKTLYTLDGGTTIQNEIRGKTLKQVEDQLEHNKRSVLNRLLSAQMLGGDWFFFHKMKVGA